jgi:hypothetical protein
MSTESLSGNSTTSSQSAKCGVDLSELRKGLTAPPKDKATAIFIFAPTVLPSGYLSPLRMTRITRE